MKILIAEDDLTSRLYLKKILEPIGDCDITVNGLETVEIFKQALDDNEPYDLICMDIMMPDLDGQQALKQIREEEKKHDILLENEVKVLMISALDDPKNVFEAMYKGGAAAFLRKPIDKKKIIDEIKNLGFQVDV